MGTSIEYPQSAKVLLLSTPNKVPVKREIVTVFFLGQVFFWVYVYNIMDIASGSDYNAPLRHSPTNFPERTLVQYQVCVSFTWPAYAGSYGALKYICSSNIPPSPHRLYDVQDIHGKLMHSFQNRQICPR